MDISQLLSETDPWCQSAALTAMLPEVEAVALSCSAPPAAASTPLMLQELDADAGVGGIKDIFPIKNLSSELQPSQAMGLLLYRALHNMLMTGVDSLAGRENEEREVRLPCIELCHKGCRMGACMILTKVVLLQPEISRCTRCLAATISPFTRARVLLALGLR